jgi:hypothetical protein
MLISATQKYIPTIAALAIVFALSSGGSNPSAAQVPQCTASISCINTEGNRIPFGFPYLKVDCPGQTVDFVQFPTTPDPSNVSLNTSSATVQTNDVFSPDNTIGACAPMQQSLFGPQPNLKECATFSLFEPSPTFCGAVPPPPPNVCKLCIESSGICTTGPGGKKFCVHE